MGSIPTSSSKFMITPDVIWGFCLIVIVGFCLYELGKLVRKSNIEDRARREKLRQQAIEAVRTKAVVEVRTDGRRYTIEFTAKRYWYEYGVPIYTSAQAEAERFVKNLAVEGLFLDKEKDDELTWYPPSRLVLAEIKLVPVDNPPDPFTKL